MSGIGSAKNIIRKGFVTPRRVLGSLGLVSLLALARAGFKSEKKKFSKIGRFRKIKRSFGGLGPDVELVRPRPKKKKLVTRK